MICECGADIPSQAMWSHMRGGKHKAKMNILHAERENPGWKVINAPEWDVKTAEEMGWKRIRNTEYIKGNISRPGYFHDGFLAPQGVDWKKEIEEYRKQKKKKRQREYHTAWRAQRKKHHEEVKKLKEKNIPEPELREGEYIAQLEKIEVDVVEKKQECVIAHTNKRKLYTIHDDAWTQWETFHTPHVESTLRNSLPERYEKTTWKRQGDIFFEPIPPEEQKEVQEKGESYKNKDIMYTRHIAEELYSLHRDVYARGKITHPEHQEIYITEIMRVHRARIRD